MKKLTKGAGIALAAAALLGFAGCPQVPEHEHTFAEEWTSNDTHHWHAATCEHKDEVDGKAEHTWDEGKVTTKPTCVTKGVKTYQCSVCQQSKTEEIPELYSSPVDAETGLAATASSEYIYFGVFPKTVLPLDSTDTVDENDKVEMGANTYYKGKGNDGEYYAKVTAKTYSSSYKYTDESVTTNDAVRYFKVEPIKWKVLTADYNGTGKALLLAEDILTANVPYYESTSNRTIDGKTVYPNNYQHSQIRAYLNGLTYQGQSGEVAKWNGNGFLQTAFTNVAQGRIVTTTVDNSAASTTDLGNNITKATDFVCENTSDKVFLLSLKEVTTTTYGFAAYNSYGDGSTRIRKPTDYAKANYAYQDSETRYGGCWWLRSPCYGLNNGAYMMSSVGYASEDRVNSTDYGVVPALSISLQ